MRLTAVVTREDYLANLIDKLEVVGYSNRLSFTELDEKLEFRDIETNIDYQQEYEGNSYVISLDVGENNKELIKTILKDSQAIEVNYQH